MRGLAPPSGSLIVPDIAGYAASLDSYEKADIAKASALLKKAGQDGLAFPDTCRNDESINEEDFYEAIFSIVTRARCKPTVEIGPRAVQPPKRSKGEIEMFKLSWANASTLDAFSSLSQVLSSKEGSCGVTSHGGWSVPEMDDLAKSPAAAKDGAERAALQEQALKIAKDKVLLIPQHQKPIAWPINKRIESIDLGADDKAK